MRRTLTDLFLSANGGGILAGALRFFVPAIFGVGCVRFALSVSGVDNSLTRYASMTVVIAIAILYFASRPSQRRERLIISYALIAPYMLVETLSLGYTWRTGTATIFHTPPYTFGVELPVHFWGHIVGGITWEPLFVFLLISASSIVRKRGREDEVRSREMSNKVKSQK